MPENKNPINVQYEILEKLFDKSPLNTEITKTFIKINKLCQTKIDHMNQLALTSDSTAKGKNYIVFSLKRKSKSNKKKDTSRPVNIDLYKEGLALNTDGFSKIETFWNNVMNHSIKNQSPRDITAALYTIAMNYCCCADLLDGVKDNGGIYFEKLVGHLYSMHLQTAPSSHMNTVELNGESISIPTDFIFDRGKNKPKFHVPAKASTRERAVEVWAQQRLLDGAFGVGRFICLLTCIGETNKRKNMSVKITCVPNQWMNYQLFISQIKRAYYLDMPEKYKELNDRFPPIHVKEFGEFFHETDNLVD